MVVATSQARLFDVIRLLRRSSTPLSLSEIARSLKIAPSSAHAILTALLHEEAVGIDRDKRYRLGPAVFYLGASFARNAPVHRSIWSELVRLARDVDLTATVAVPWAGHHLVLAVHQNGGQVGVAIGSRIPLQAGSYGKVYYAWSVARIPTTLVSYTPASVSSITEYQKAVRKARQLGYATDKEEFVVGVGAVATAVTSDGGFEGLAALMGSSDHLTQLGYERVGERLAALGARASIILGDMTREVAWGDG